MEPPSPHTPSNPFFPTHASSTFSRRRADLSPEFRAKLSQMSLRLAPLVQLTSGQIHPSFPQTLLSFWLLTEAQLDSLAHFYHQRTPCQWTRHYPCPVYWPFGLTLEEKRRKLGRFIGLRGCDTPGGVVGNWEGGPGPGSGGISEDVWLRMNRSEEEVERDARRAREEAADGRKWY